MTRRSLAALTALATFTLAAPVFAQPPAPPPSCEDRLDNATLSEAQAKAELAQTRFQARHTAKQLDDATKQIADLKKAAAEAKPGADKK